MIGAKHPDNQSSNPSGCICNFYLYRTPDWEKALEKWKKEKKRDIEEKEKLVNKKFKFENFLFSICKKKPIWWVTGTHTYFNTSDGYPSQILGVNPCWFTEIEPLRTL
jgi:hypothetical protein